MTEDLSYQWKDDYEDVKVKEEELIEDHVDDPLSYGVKGRDLYIGKNQKLFQNQNYKWRNFAKTKNWHLF